MKADSVVPPNRKHSSSATGRKAPRSNPAQQSINIRTTRSNPSGPAIVASKVRHTSTRSLASSANTRTAAHTSRLPPLVVSSALHDDSYDPKLRPDEFKCPFSDPSRANPCNTLKDGIKKKTQITNHLLSVEGHGGDSQHPEDDPLWNSRLIKNYYLCKRPVYDLDERRVAMREYNKRAYQKRLDREAAQRETAEAAFKQGTISADEFRTILVGAKRIRFDLEYSVTQKVQQQLATKIAELRLQEQPTDDALAHLAELEESQRKCTELNEKAQGYKDQLIGAVRQFIEWFGNPDAEGVNLIESGEGLLEYSGLSFPIDDSEDTYYFWAAMLTPKNKWKGSSPWTDDVIRNLRAQLQLLVTRWLSEPGLSDESIEEIRQRQQHFNSACDRVKARRDESETFNMFDSEMWLDTQAEIWQGAQDYVNKVFNSFTGAAFRPVDVISTVDQYAQLIKHMDDAVVEATTAANYGLERLDRACR